MWGVKQGEMKLLDWVVGKSGSIWDELGDCCEEG